jgi:hypothetical protein
MKIACPKRNHCNYRAQIHAIGLPKSDRVARLSDSPVPNAKEMTTHPAKNTDVEGNMNRTRPMYASPFSVTEAPA